MGILLFLPLLVITFIAYIVVKPLSARRTVGICVLGIALFTVAGFSGFMLGGVSRMYSMKVEIHNLLKNTTNALNTNCEEVKEKHLRSDLIAI